MFKLVHKTIALVFMSTLLVACGGDDNTHSNAVIDDPKNISPIEDGDGYACLDIYQPVCAIQKQVVQCLNEPCLQGIYKTYSNSCYASFEDTEVQFQGECGDLEGTPFYDHNPVSCAAVYEPVCAAKPLIEPCLTSPCPKELHHTYGNACEASQAKARFIREGECGELEKAPVTSLEGACDAAINPVCGKRQLEVTCAGIDCPTHQYSTYNNACEASLDLADIVKLGTCDALENLSAPREPVVQLVEQLPKKTKRVNIEKASIQNHILNVTLSYSGCAPQHFTFQAASASAVNGVLQLDVAFQEQIADSCAAFFITDFAYDLLPLKYAYLDQYDSVNIPGIGVYEF